ncbi:unnamed protein product [Euphydryas editha]|uniref:Uncharacterized protein n=1 Tax=Euphydryas editha TaxID=104508 RepID=A0AAU9TFF8_EUPED|nr:unnamed protein product [Euphydryas editha]
MNKLLIVLLAVCLVSVHAFVKRDIQQEVKQPDTFHKIQEDIETFAKNAKDKLSEVFDPENVKKGFNDAVDKIHEVASHIIPNTEEAKH